MDNMYALILTRLQVGFAWATEEWHWLPVTGMKQIYADMSSRSYSDIAFQSLQAS